MKEVVVELRKIRRYSTLKLKPTLAGDVFVVFFFLFFFFVLSFFLHEMSWMGYEGFTTYSEHAILILLGLGMQTLNLKRLKYIIYEFFYHLKRIP